MIHQEGASQVYRHDSTVPPPNQSPDQPRISLWERVSFAITHALVAAVLFCLSLPGLYRVGRIFGTLEWLVDYRRRRRFAAAMTRALGCAPTPARRRRETREFFMRTRCDKLFYLIFDRIPRERAPALFIIENQSRLDESLGRGNGVYLALSHHGSHHVMAMLLALRGYKTVGVRDRNEGALRRYVQQRFDERYPEFARTRWLFSDAYPREVYRCLEQGLVVGSTMDVSRIRSERQKTEEVTIFGEKRRFPTGPIRIAIKCRTPIVQAFITPESNFRYRMHVVEILFDPRKDGDEAAIVADVMRAYAANVERYIRAAPNLMSRI